MSVCVCKYMCVCDCVCTHNCVFRNKAYVHRNITTSVAGSSSSSSLHATNHQKHKVHLTNFVNSACLCSDMQRTDTQHPPTWLAPQHLLC